MRDPGSSGAPRVFNGRDRGASIDQRPVDDSQRRVGPDMPQRPDATACEGAEILGRVGSEVILAKELSWGIAELRSQNKEAPQDLLEAKIREILKQRVAQKIDERLVVQDAQRTIPKDNFPRIRDNVAREFEASQVPRLTKTTGARTRQELENALEASGSSLEMQKQSFVDGVLAHEWLRQQVKIEEDVGHEEMLDYYREHVSDFETPARARWEQLTVRLSRFPTREEAYAALAQMGNQILDGTPLAEVAKAQSHGSTAPQGGAWNWTSQGSLASQVIDRAIFGDGARPGLPVGSLSPILEDEQALHIIRVVQREIPQRTPFEKAQVEIKKKIRAEREVKAKQDYLAKLRRQTPVWTAFDAPAMAERPPATRY
jgi:parvulin-like peptidyl-prolyl isomerase